jgi:membrane-bound ClpP family serine protease
MLLASIIAIILFGIILIVLEILILPGLIAGIIGAIFMVMGLLMMYKNYGDFYGNITLIATIALTAGSLIYALKSKAWRRFGLKDTIDSKVIDLTTANIEPGTVGITISALRPMGTVMIGNEMYEVQTTGTYIEANNKVIVLKVMTNKLLVELKS